MPRTPVPPDVDEFLSRPNPATIATLRPDGSPHSAATWYDWDGGRVLVNMDATRLRLEYLRRDPRISLTVLDDESWYRQVTLMGRVVEIVPDDDLVDIDRLARRYTGNAYRDRARKSISAWLEPERWYGWISGGHWGS
ncbi:MAG: PPOX class F420-dependent oxidoreductase [Gaiellaceae bacterium]|jgi:PPOX class probable F420-dependent enzyme|nr:PPOX class F420-dependent oxidoreductase [Acidobacteriota bacterium]